MNTMTSAQDAMKAARGAPDRANWLATAAHFPVAHFTSRRPVPPDTIVLHWSAGGGGPRAVAEYLARRRASYHFVVGRDGQLGQLVSLAHVAWHAGDGEAWDPSPTINQRSVGVCLANRGPVTSETLARKLGKARLWRGKHHRSGFDWKQFERYTAEQRATLVDLIAELRVRLLSLFYVCGHEDVTKGKGDPGPCLPLLDVDWRALGLTYRRRDWKTDRWLDSPPARQAG